MGTWLVQAICRELDELQEDVDLLQFLTRVQNNVCNRILLRNPDLGQTPQLHFFATRDVTLCASHCKQQRSQLGCRLFLKIFLAVGNYFVKRDQRVKRAQLLL
jgi:hypothetical protein